MTLRRYSICIESVGCRTNQEEMAALADALTAGGNTIVSQPADADIIIVNTCSVTAVSEGKTRRLLLRLNRRAPAARLLVTGCLAQQKPSEILNLPGVCWVVGNNHKSSIPAVLSGDQSGITHSSFSRTDPVSAYPDILPAGSEKARQTRFSLKIQEGCDASCAYCIVPRLRGPSRSVPQTALIDRFIRATNAGYKEIVITGTHIGQYHDAESGAGLWVLLKALVALPGDFRIRLSSLDPHEGTAAFLEWIAGQEKICPHIHFSIQSMDETVLAGMGRHPADVMRLVTLVPDFRSRYPQLCIGADIIAGFPGETDARFKTTLDRISESGICYGHVFRFSVRPGTRAELMDQKNDPAVIDERSDILREVLAGCRTAFVQLQKNGIHRIIVEEVDPASGLTSNYIRVTVPGSVAVRNSWMNVRLSAWNTATLICQGSPV